MQESFEVVGKLFFCFSLLLVFTLFFSVPVFGWVHNGTISDNWNDGDYTNNPTWTMGYGTAEVNDSKLQLENDEWLYQEDVSAKFLENNGNYSFLINLSYRLTSVSSAVATNRVRIGHNLSKASANNGYEFTLIIDNEADAECGILVYTNNSVSVYSDATVLSDLGCGECEDDYVKVSFERLENGSFFINCLNQSSSEWVK